MQQQLIAFLATLVPMLLMDGSWLTLMSKRFYSPQLGSLVADTPSFGPVLLFYPIYAFAVSVFVVMPALHSGQGLLRTFLLGALFGFAAYAAYDLTNQATLKNWPMIVSVVDMAWGTFLTGTGSVVALILSRYFS